MPGLRTSSIRLADAQDRIVELEAEIRSLAALLADRENVVALLQASLAGHAISTQTVNPFQMEMIANSGAQGLNTVAQQPPRAPQTAPDDQAEKPISDPPYVGLWRALRAGKG